MDAFFADNTDFVAWGPSHLAVLGLAVALGGALSWWGRRAPEAARRWVGAGLGGLMSFEVLCVLAWMPFGIGSLRIVGAPDGDPA